MCILDINGFSSLMISAAAHCDGSLFNRTPLDLLSQTADLGFQRPHLSYSIEQSWYWALDRLNEAPLCGAECWGNKDAKPAERVNDLGTSLSIIPSMVIWCTAEFYTSI